MVQVGSEKTSPSQTRRRVLVTGANGLVGYALCKRLIGDGWELVALGRKDTAQFKATFSLPCEYHKWPDPPHSAPPEESLQNIQAVIHLMGEPIADHRWTAAIKKSLSQSRISSTRQLVQAIRSHTHRPSVFISASAIGYYGNRGEEALNERSEPGKDFLAELCSAWEYEARQAPCRNVQIRTGVVLAGTGGALAKMAPLFERGMGGRIGTGNQWTSWIHLEDLVNIFIHALHHTETQGPVNAVSPVPVRNREFTSCLAHELKVKAWFPVPGPVLRLALGERAQILLSSQRVLPTVLTQQGLKFRFENIQDALSNIFHKNIACKNKKAWGDSQRL